MQLNRRTIKAHYVSRGNAKLQLNAAILNKVKLRLRAFLPYLNKETMPSPAEEIAEALGKKTCTCRRKHLHYGSQY